MTKVLRKSCYLCRNCEDFVDPPTCIKGHIIVGNGPKGLVMDRRAENCKDYEPFNEKFGVAV